MSCLLIVGRKHREMPSSLINSGNGSCGSGERGDSFAILCDTSDKTANEEEENEEHMMTMMNTTPAGTQVVSPSSTLVSSGLATMKFGNRKGLPLILCFSKQQYTTECNEFRLCLQLPLSGAE